MSIPNFHVVNAIQPVADFAATSFDSDIVKALGEGVLVIIYSGAVSGAAASTITVEACSTITATAVATVPFIYRECVATDVWGEWTAAAATGFSALNTVAGSMWQIWVDSAELAEEGYTYVRLSGDETANFTILGGVLAIVVTGRYEPRTTTLLT
jgi:hypothetical protein